MTPYVLKRSVKTIGYKLMIVNAGKFHDVVKVDKL